MAHYNKKSFKEGLVSSGITRGDILFSHSNIGFFGLPEETSQTNEVLEIILDAIFEVIGAEGTLIVPTFTYSFPKDEIFDPEGSPGVGGSFSEMIRKLPESYRSYDPTYSVAAIGSCAEELTKNMPSNSFESNGIFGRLLDVDAKVCNMNIDAASTFVHYAERKLNVPYRFDKTFKGTIRINGVDKEASNTIWVRYLHESTQPAFEPFDEIAKSKGLYRQSRIGRGFIKVMTIEDQFNLIKNVLPESPWFLTKAGITGKIPKIAELKK